MEHKIENPSKYLGNELKYLQKVLEGESWSATGGSWTIGLEQAFSRRIGTKYGVAFNSEIGRASCRERVYPVV